MHKFSTFGTPLLLLLESFGQLMLLLQENSLQQHQLGLFMLVDVTFNTESNLVPLLSIAVVLLACSIVSILMGVVAEIKLIYLLWLLRLRHAVTKLE